MALRRPPSAILLDVAVAAFSAALAWWIAGPSTRAPLFDNDSYDLVVEGAWLRMAAVGAAAVPALRVARLGVTPWLPLMVLAAGLEAFSPTRGDGHWQDPGLPALVVLCLVLLLVGMRSWWCRARAMGWARADGVEVAALLFSAALWLWAAGSREPEPVYSPYVVLAVSGPRVVAAYGFVAALCLPVLRVARSQGARDVALWLAPLALVWLGPWRWLAWTQHWRDPNLRPHVELMMGPPVTLVAVIAAAEFVALGTLIRRRSALAGSDAGAAAATAPAPTAR